MQDVFKCISDIGIVPVVKLTNPQRDAVPLARALIAGGIPIMEVTFRAAGAADAIGMIRNNCPEMLVGAGTVLSLSQIDEAQAAGAQFLVTPGMDPLLVEYAKEKRIPVIPGCSTASDCHAAYRLGLSIIKFFPAEASGGIKKMKALHGPFPMFQVMPTGGISLKNLREYSACSFVAACGGSYMVAEDLVKQGHWDEIFLNFQEAILGVSFKHLPAPQTGTSILFPLFFLKKKKTQILIAIMYRRYAYKYDVT